LRDDISHMFKNVFIGVMLLICFSLVMIIFASGIGIDLNSNLVGSFFGAAISGVIAIVIMTIQMINSNKENSIMFLNYNIKKVVDLTNDFIGQWYN
jgi:hypothetical protein